MNEYKALSQEKWVNVEVRFFTILSSEIALTNTTKA